MFIVLLFLTACRHSDRTMSFYYWRTTFTLDSTEKAALRDNHVRHLYIRYFDVDKPGDHTTPVAPITFTDSIRNIDVTPVIFIRDRVFENTNIDTLAQNILNLVSSIDISQRLNHSTIQFDCDWTEKTRDAFFSFLKAYRTLSKQTITCTIRLHQIKYPARTGIPPVDRGILMYYNIGAIDAGTGNSIYTPQIAQRYIPFLRSYPLALDIALPIFTWGLQIRDGKVIALLNKMNFGHFENDPNFTRQKDGRFLAISAGFNGGYYFKAGDLVKIEHVDEPALRTIAEDINRYSNHRLHDITFYVLDASNIRLYDKKDLGKVLDRFD